jgi:hypothetical protein
MSVYKNFQQACDIADIYSRQLKRNYTVILLNPVEGLFDGIESTYEIVQDSYFINNPDEIKVYEANYNAILEEEFPHYPEFFKNDSFQEVMAMKKYATMFDEVYTPPFIRGEKFGRNQLCSCNSGKKNKKCCKS